MIALIQYMLSHCGDHLIPLQPTPQRVQASLPQRRAWVEDVSQLPNQLAAAMESESEDWLESSSARPAFKPAMTTPAARRQSLPATQLHSVPESGIYCDQDNPTMRTSLPCQVSRCKHVPHTT